jgi:transposase
MDIIRFSKIASSEDKAQAFLKKRCWPDGIIFCIRCEKKKVHKLSSGRYRCQSCGLTFSDFTGRWLGQLNVSACQWLWVIKLFEMGLSARKIGQETALSYPTALKAVNLIRKCIIAYNHESSVLLQGEIEADEAYFGGKRKGKRGRGAANKVPVFGILERDGIVKVEVLKDVTAESILNLTIRTVRRGSIVYTDKFRSYDSLMFCGYRHLRIDHDKNFSSGKVYINGLEGFWSYAKERLIKYHGVSKKNFPLYLKEMEFRYNNRNNDLLPILTKNLCHLVSKLL